MNMCVHVRHGSGGVLRGRRCVCLRDLIGGRVPCSSSRPVAPMGSSPGHPRGGQWGCSRELMRGGLVFLCRPDSWPLGTSQVDQVPAMTFRRQRNMFDPFSSPGGCMSARSWCTLGMLLPTEVVGRSMAPGSVDSDPGHPPGIERTMRVPLRPSPWRPGPVKE